MANSNILKVFNPSEPQDLPEDGTKECLPCLLLSSAGAVAAGSYLCTGVIFKDTSLQINPHWWRNTVKFGGLGMILFGIYRGYEGYNIMGKDLRP